MMQQMFLGLSGTSDAILSMSNRPASQGGGSGEISNTPFTVDSSTTVIDLMVQNDTFRGVVSGTIRGARTTRINPTL